MRFVSYMTPGFPVSLFESIADEVGAELHLEETLSGPVPGDDPFRDGRFDLGWICSTSFVALSLLDTAPSVRLAGVAWVPDDPDVDGRPVYFGDVVVADGSDVESLDDLAGCRIGCNDPVSLSGHHAVRLALGDRGHDPDTFARLHFTGGHHASLDAVVAGAVDAAVVDSVVRIGRSRHDPRVADLRVVERLGPWPVQPLVARAGLDDGRVHATRDALLDDTADARLTRELEAAALSRLVPVGPEHYRPLHDAMRRTTILPARRD